MMRTHQIWGHLVYGVVSEADPTAVGPWKSGHAWVARRGLVTGRPGCEGFPWKRRRCEKISQFSGYQT